MKKVSIFMAIAAATSFAACTAQAPKENLQSDVDSLAYAIGMTQGASLSNYLPQLGVDSVHMADLLKGIVEGATKGEKSDIAYIAGLGLGQQAANGMYANINKQIFGSDTTQTISKDNLLAGIVAGALGKDNVMNLDSATAFSRTGMETVKARVMAVTYADYKLENEKFLADNKTKEGVQTTPSGLQYKVLTEGKGEVPVATSRVQVNYKGMMIDSTEFDNSYKRNAPASFMASQVIPGWTEALTMMPVGSKWELYIPQELGYGARESGQIKPFSTLIFEVELLSIEADKK